MDPYPLDWGYAYEDVPDVCKYDNPDGSVTYGVQDQSSGNEFYAPTLRAAMAEYIAYRSRQGGMKRKAKRWQPMRPAKRVQRYAPGYLHGPRDRSDGSRRW